MKSYKRTIEYKLKRAILVCEDHDHHIGVDRWMDLAAHYGRVDQIIRLPYQHAETPSKPRFDAIKYFQSHSFHTGI